MVLDGSIIPVSPRPNPALTIAVLRERAMDLIVAQIERDGAVTAEEPAEKGAPYLRMGVALYGT